MTYYRIWDFDMKQGQMAVVAYIHQPVELHLEEGRMVSSTEPPLELETIDMITAGHVEHYEYSEHVGGSHLIVNRAPSESILLDDLAHNTTFVQLLVASEGSLASNDFPTLVIDRLPYMCAYQMD